MASSTLKALLFTSQPDVNHTKLRIVHADA